MSMPNIPDIKPEIKINTKDAANLILSSIGLEEMGLAHIINAEGEKIQAFLGTLDTNKPRIKKDLANCEEDTEEMESDYNDEYDEYDKDDKENEDIRKTKEIQLKDLKELDEMVNKTLNTVIKKELLLLMKLDSTKELMERQEDHKPHK